MCCDIAYLYVSKPEPSSGRSLGHVASFSRPFNSRAEFNRAVRAGTISFGPVPDPSEPREIRPTQLSPASSSSKAGSSQHRRLRPIRTSIAAATVAAGGGALAPAPEKKKAGANIRAVRFLDSDAKAPAAVLAAAAGWGLVVPKGSKYFCNIYGLESQRRAVRHGALAGQPLLKSSSSTCSNPFPGFF
ncbi:uncharacterized protein [Miscanthus floridulus]|uniref:uncharacterized protein isoform X1 n=1 Tax=Miscanthus floridulus TaxID=154761 RepID=UPI0034584DE5